MSAHASKASDQSSPRLLDTTIADLEIILSRRDEQLFARFSVMVQQANELAAPISASELDAKFALRKGSTAAAIRAGVLAACSRPGRGGNTMRILSSDAENWFRRNCPIK